jgi:ParB family chromosome partitioning protein
LTTGAPEGGRGPFRDGVLGPDRERCSAASTVVKDSGSAAAFHSATPSISSAAARRAGVPSTGRIPVPAAATSRHSAGKATPTDPASARPQRTGTGVSSSAAKTPDTTRTPASHPTRPVVAILNASTSTDGCRSRNASATRSSPPRSLSTSTRVASASRRGSSEAAGGTIGADPTGAMPGLRRRVAFPVTCRG